MADKTGIEWTDATWNPLRGCSRVSEGCRHCYAENVAMRFSGPGGAYEGLVRINSAGVRQPEWNGSIKFIEEHLLDPLRWKRPRRIFVNSVSDLFHEKVTDEMRDRIFAVMALSPHHTFQVLTKRARRMYDYLSNAAGRLADVIESMRTDMPRRAVGPLPHLNGGEHWFPLANVWMGVSVENQDAANERVPFLLMTPAAKRFLSLEPLIGPVDLEQIDMTEGEPDEDGLFDGFYINALAGTAYDDDGDLTTGVDGEVPILGKVDLAIVGGESGNAPTIRVLHPDWPRNVRDACAEHGTLFFFKQWGEWIPWEQDVAPYWRSQHGKNEDGNVLFPDDIADDPKGWDSGLSLEDEDHCVFQRVGKKAAGHLLDGVEHLYFPESAL